MDTVPNLNDTQDNRLPICSACGSVELEGRDDRSDEQECLTCGVTAPWKWVHPAEYREAAQGYPEGDLDRLLEC